MVSTYSCPTVDCDAGDDGDLLTCGDLCLAFFGLVLHFTEKLHCLVPEG